MEALTSDCSFINCQQIQHQHLQNDDRLVNLYTKMSSFRIIVKISLHCLTSKVGKQANILYSFAAALGGTGVVCRTA